MASDESSRSRGMEAVFIGSEAGRGAYLSRLFAFFSEEVVRHWAACAEAPYRDLGRPVIWDHNSRTRYHVLDFTLERRGDGARYVAELKCEIEFEGYRYMTLAGPGQLEHHAGKAAFQKLLQMATDPQELRATIGRQELTVDGSILVWGALTPEGRTTTMDRYGFADVLSVQDMLHDLAIWQPPTWAEWVAVRRRWTDER
jgi:hypothetical protein